MKIITNQSDNVIIGIYSNVEFLDSGVLKCDDNHFLSNAISYGLYDVADTTGFEVGKMCYDGVTLTPNPHYSEPISLDEEVVALKEVVDSILVSILEV